MSQGNTRGDVYAAIYQVGGVTLRLGGRIFLAESSGTIKGLSTGLLAQGKCGKNDSGGG